MLAECRGAGPLTLVVVGGLRALGGGDLEVVAEDLVVAHARAAGAGALALALLQRGDPRARVAGQTAVLIELLGNPGLDDTRFEHGGAVTDGGADVLGG